MPYFMSTLTKDNSRAHNYLSDNNLKFPTSISKSFISSRELYLNS